MRPAVYIDTSAIIKQYIPEPYSPELVSMLKEAEMIVVSRLIQVEFAAGISKAFRLNLIPASHAQQVMSAFEHEINAYYLLAVDAASISRAASLAWRLGIRGHDAVHLATALEWQEALSVPVTLATFDRQLWQVAKTSGLGVWPDTL